MEKYRKSDQYYIDEYDRCTIDDLKEREASMLDAMAAFEKSEENDREKLFSRYLSLEMAYNTVGTGYARNKRLSIQDSMMADERRDRILQSTRVPSDIRCKTCQLVMNFDLHDFTGIGDELIFIFSCPEGHIPKRGIYADGREYYTKVSKCSYCGGGLKSRKKKTRDQLIFTDTCQDCGKIEVTEFSTKKRKINPIDEKERKKYCTDFIGRRTFEEDLKALADLSPLMGREEDSNYSYANVQQLNIAKLEALLTQEIEKSDFLKLAFEKPKTGKYLTMEFSVQDPTDREAAKSIKKLKKLIETVLFQTNWRLMLPGISCTLGFLNGQLKGYSNRDDLIKIAKEIRENNRRNLK